MGKARLCVVLESAQGLNLNENPKLSFVGKLSHWLKIGIWVLVIYIMRPTLLKHLLSRCLFHQNGWFTAARVPLAKYVSGHASRCEPAILMEEAPTKQVFQQGRPNNIYNKHPYPNL